MPRRAAKPCAHPGCPTLVQQGPYCTPHQQANATRYARQDRRRRGTAHERGYDARWRRLREWHLNREPLCQDCKAEGITTPAQDVDHIVPFDGRGDPLRLDPTNLRSLCRAHHNRKTARQAARDA